MCAARLPVMPYDTAPEPVVSLDPCRFAHATLKAAARRSPGEHGHGAPLDPPLIRRSPPTVAPPAGSTKRARIPLVHHTAAPLGWRRGPHRFLSRAARGGSSMTYLHCRLCSMACCSTAPLDCREMKPRLWYPAPARSTSSKMRFQSSDAL